MEVFRVFGSMVLKDEASSELDKVEGKAQGTERTFAGSMGTIAKWGAAIAAASVVAGGAILGLMGKYGNFADQLLDTAAITGMSTDELQRWRSLAVNAGVDLEAVSGSLERFNKQIERGNELSPRLAKAFETMGIGVEEFKALEPDVQMREIVETMMELDEADARAFANQMNMPELLPIIDDLKSEGKSLDEIMEEIDVPFDEEALEKMNEFRRQWDQLKESIFILIGEALQPLFEWFDANSEQIEEFTANVLEGMITSIQNLITWFQEYQNIIIPIVGTVAGVVVASWTYMAAQAAIAATKNAIAAAKKIAAWVLMGAQSTIQAARVAAAWLIAMGPVGWAIGVMAGLVAAVIIYWDEIVEYTEWLADKFEEIWDGILTFIEGWWSSFWSFWEEKWLGLEKWFKETWGRITGWLEESLNEISRTWDRIWDNISGKFSSIWEGIRDTFYSIWNSILSGIEGGINYAISGINGFIERVNNVLQDLVFFVDIPVIGRLNEVSLPRLAEGGDILRSGAAIVGEEGPEILDLPTGAQVRPLSADNGGVTFERGAFEGTFILDDYGVDRLMERVVQRLRDETGMKL